MSERDFGSRDARGRDQAKARPGVDPQQELFTEKIMHVLVSRAGD
jgi:hypothetical protein